MTDITAIAATVSGRVHGVGFRVSTQRAAANLGLAGWVRNCPDGAVETLIHGPDEAVKQMVAWLKHGPPAAVVSRIQVTPADGEALTSGFKITH